MNPIEPNCRREALRPSPEFSLKDRCDWRNESSLYPMQQSREGFHSIFQSIWKTILSWLGYFSPSPKNFNAGEFKKLAPLNKLANLDKMLRNEQTSMKDLFDAFALLEEEDRIAILRDIWKKEGGQALQNHPLNHQGKFGERFFEQNPRHNSVLIAVRAQILVSEASQLNSTL